MTNTKLCEDCGAELMRDVCEDCGGEGGSGESNCCDDLCNGGEVPCMHGDETEYTCGTCDGRGGWDWCPVCITKDKSQEK